MPPPRDIVHHPDYDADCARLGPLPQIDLATRYVTYRLAQNPEMGIQITATLWARPFRLFIQGRVRNFAIYYRFDDQTLTLRSLGAIFVIVN
jgi:hypothetical protein